jgi:hypothetical protein
MGMAAYYARLSTDQVEVLTRDPGLFWTRPEMPEGGVAGGAARLWVDMAWQDTSQLLYLDKDWQILSWLCSLLGNVEERNQAAFMRVIERKENGEDLSAESAFKAALAEETVALGFPYLDPDSLPADPVLTAIQGRREGDDGARIADLGMAASVFNPDEVKMLSAALAGIDETAMRYRFDIEEMEILDLPGDWQETDFDEFYFPQLQHLRALYSRAAEAGQYVVVVIE